MVFFWEGNTGGVTTPQQAARKRAISEAMLGQSRSGANNWGEGLARVAQALTGTVLEGRASDAERAGADEVAALLAGLSPESGFSDISAALANPWLAESPGAAAIAQALLGENMRRSDPMYGIGLEKAQLELDRLRNPAAPEPIKVGDVLLDPVTFQPLYDGRTDTGFTLSPGQQRFDALGNPIASVAQTEPDLTNAIQNYEYLIGQGVDPASAQQAAFGGQTINVGGPSTMGTIPQGFAAVEDPTNPSGFRLEMIPGGPAAAEAAAAEEQAAMRGEQAGRYSDVVMEDIDRALGLVGGDTTGMLGSLLQNIPGTNSRNLDALLQTIRSNIGFDRLQSMREASPTGGALGAVSDFENRQLQATLGNLEQSQTEEQLRRNLERVKEVYTNIMRKAAAYPNAAEFGFDGFVEPELASSAEVDYTSAEPPANWSGSPDLWRFMSPEDRALWK